MLLDAVAYERCPSCSSRVSSQVPVVSETGLSSNPFGKAATGQLLKEYKSFLSYRQAEGFNAIANYSQWDWESLFFLQKQLSGRALGINIPDWLPSALPRCTFDTAIATTTLPKHYEYYRSYFEAMITDNPDRDIPVWKTTLKPKPLIASWNEQPGWDRIGGLWYRQQDYLI
jgi:hypothetical protein